MLKDALSEFSSAQVVTASAAGSNVLDLGAAGDAALNELFFHVIVRAAALADGSATVTFALQTATDFGFTTPITLYQSDAIGKANLTKGAHPVRVRVPSGAKRYLRCYYTVATGPLTAGTFDAFLSFDA